MPIQKMIIEARCDTCAVYHDITRITLTEGDTGFHRADRYRLPSPRCRVSNQSRITLVDYYDRHTTLGLDELCSEANRRGHDSDNT